MSIGRHVRAWGPLFFCIVFISVLFTGCSKEELPPSDRVLATVNDYEITVGDFEKSYVRHLIETGSNDTRAGRYSFLNETIDRVLMGEESSEKGNLDNEIYQEAVFFQQRKSMMDHYFVDRMNEVLEPATDEELRLAFAKSKRKVYVRHLYSKNAADLTMPYRRLVNGENFVDVANDFYQTSEYDSSAGYLGPINYFGVDNAFAEAAFSTNQGEFTKPIRSRLGFHIIYVEYIEFPAMLVEDEYQYRKKGIQSQVRLRTQSIKADEYVRNLMESLLVEVDAPNVLALREAINGVTGDEIVLNEIDRERQYDIWTENSIDQLAASFDKEAVLASFVLDGERIEFTFEDYLMWLPYLSYGESRNRTGASIGRAIRDEVFYQLAEKANYEADSRVQKDVKIRGYEILSELYEYQLMQEVRADTSTVEIPDEFRKRKGGAQQKMLTAEYWKIGADDIDEAKKIVEELSEGSSPEKYKSYVKFERRDILSNEDEYRMVRYVELDKPVVVRSHFDGWFVIRVSSREEKEVLSPSKERTLQLRYKAFKTLSDEVSDLRSDADVEINTELFDEIYQVWNKRRQDESE